VMVRVIVWTPGRGRFIGVANAIGCTVYGSEAQHKTHPMMKQERSKRDNRK
jgi:hypothetical protein